MTLTSGSTTKQDQNRFPAGYGLAGSNGTAAMGTEDLVVNRNDAATGAQYVYNLGPAGSVTIGNTPGGTINEVGSLLGIRDVVQVSGTVSTGGAGTQPVEVIKGTVTNVGTVVGLGTVTNIGSLTNIGTIKEITNIAGGTVVSALVLNTGTITTITAGTQNTLGTVGVLNSGNIGSLGGASVLNYAPSDTDGNDSGPVVQTETKLWNGANWFRATGDVTNGADVDVTRLPGLPTGTITTIAAGTQNTLGTVAVVNNLVKGTITALETGTLTALAVGTVGGKAASGAAAVANPVQIAGTDAGGTIYSPLVTAGGALTVTGASAGTVVQVETGTLGLVSNLTSGSVRMTVGTVTTGSLTNLATLHNGTVVISAVTPAISVAPAAAGDFGERQEDSAHSSGQKGLFVLAVRNDGGTSLSAEDLDYSAFQTDANGALRISGTVATGAGTQPVELIKGTVTSLGTLVGAGTLTNLGSVTNIGTVKEAGTVTGVGVVTAVTSVAELVKGTVTLVPTVTTVSNLTNGTVRVSVGTIVGPTASGGTPTTAPVLIAGTDVTGTVYAPVVTAAGALSISGPVTVGTIAGIGVVTSVTNLASGTLLNSGTTTGVGVVTSVSELVKGTVTLVPTVTTVSNLTNGSVNILTGTIQSSGTTTGVGVVSNLTNGSVNLLTGTVTSVSNLAAGTITALALGTMKINPTPVGSVILSTHTLGTGGGTQVGTLVAPVGAGTNLYLSGISIICRSGGTVDAGIANNVAGTTGAGIYARGFFPVGGGIARDFQTPINIGANGTLAYFIVTAGTVDFTANYWVAP